MRHSRMVDGLGLCWRALTAFPRRWVAGRVLRIMRQDVAPGGKSGGAGASESGWLLDAPLTRCGTVRRSKAGMAGRGRPPHVLSS